MIDDMRWMLEQQIPHLRRYAIAITRNRDLADDLVQDCLERALRKHHLWHRRGSVRNWLFRILYHAYIDQHRQKERSSLAADAAADAQGTVQPANQEHRIEHRNIAEALDKLPKEQRAIILMVALEGMTYDEIADVMGIPVGTVRSRLSRGRDSLRRLRDGKHSSVRLRRVK